MLTECKTYKYSNEVRYASGGLLISIACIVMLAWKFRIIDILAVIPNAVPMQFNTALVILFLGITCITTRFFNFYSFLIFGFGFLAIIQHATGLPVGLGELFQEHYYTANTSSPGLMAPNTAICFMLIGTANIFRRLAILNCVAFAISLTALFGYLSHTHSAFGWSDMTDMAIHTSIAILIKTACISCWTNRRGYYGISLFIFSCMFSYALNIDGFDINSLLLNMLIIFSSLSCSVICYLWHIFEHSIEKHLGDHQIEARLDDGIKRLEELQLKVSKASR